MGVTLYHYLLQFALMLQFAVVYDDIESVA